MNFEFFELLYANPSFCEAMGKATLATGRLESALNAFLRSKGVQVPEQGASLGQLIATLERHRLVSENGIRVLRDVKRQRNYLTHNLFELFAGRVPETVLPRTGLVPMDVLAFTDKARSLEENMLGLSQIAERRLAELTSTPPRGETDEYLFRP